MDEIGKFLFILSVRGLVLALAHHDIRSTGGTGGTGHPQPGLCSYGPLTSCCPGWRNVDGSCQPVCRTPCWSGVCVGPDVCSCSRGFKGPLCDQDVNECGSVRRPCSQRCMNTHGSYRCYCEPGYTLAADGSTCHREPACSTPRCQFGCHMERGGAMRCLCPPGLHLAADNKTCEDVDECEQSGDACPQRRTCRNTFGSFVCVCKDGFVMGTLEGSVQCRDINECLTATHRCSRHAQCVNTDGSFTCQCRDSYHGDGRTCRPRRAPQSKAHMYYNYKLSRRSKQANQSS